MIHFVSCNIMNAVKLSKDNEDITKNFRQHLHRHPELSGQEFETLRYIKEALENYHIEYIEVENGGILGFIGEEAKGRTILLRADIDALPILENENNLKGKRKVISENPGVHHACGHDAHTAILLTAGKILKENERELQGRVILFFERGEEGGGNIHYLLEYIKDNNIHIDFAHGIHVSSYNKSGELVINKGPYCAGCSGLSVVITGKDGHGSRPDLANHPLDCFVAIYNALNTIRLKYVSPFEHLTFIVGQIHNGNVGNIIAKDLSFVTSARFYNTEVGERFIDEVKNIIENTTKVYHCNYEISQAYFGDPVVNNPKVAEIAQEIAATLGAGILLKDQEPSMGSESFSRISSLYPSVMLRLGIANEEVGSGAGHHTEFFDIDENALYVGVAETLAFTEEILNRSGDSIYDIK